MQTWWRSARFRQAACSPIPLAVSTTCPVCVQRHPAIARFDAARPLAELLRGALIEVHKQRQANAGRSEKMELLYNYICSPQFAQRLKSIYDGFVTMREELEAEKTAMARIWKKREAQLTRMQDGLLSVVGDLQGIGEEAVPALDVVAALPGVAEIEA